MGYESKIYIVERCEYEAPSGDKIVHGLVVAMYDLCKMGWNAEEFYNAFRNEIDYRLYLPGTDEQGNEAIVPTDTDRYGEHMKSADIEELIEALKISEQREHYRRIPPLLAMLEAFQKEIDEWGGCNGHSLQAVHYGY